MGNRLSERNAQQIANLLGVMSGTLAGSGGAAYGLPKATTDLLATGATALTGAISASEASRAAEKTATRAKEAKRVAVVATLGGVAATLYANPAITDAQLAAVGLAPRRAATPRPQAALPVAGLAAKPAVDGSVRLSWGRSGNSKSAIFQIEASPDGVSWAIVATTTRVSATLLGYAPGAATWFRVTAVTSTTSAAPSTPVSIYAPSAPAALQLRVA